MISWLNILLVRPDRIKYDLPLQDNQRANNS